MRTAICFLYLILAVCGYGQQPELVVPTSHEERIVSTAFSPDGQYVLTWDINTAKLWDLQGRELKSYPFELAGDITVTFSPDGKNILATGWEEGEDEFSDWWDRPQVVKLWDLSGKRVESIPALAAINYATFAPDGKSMITGGPDGKVRAMDKNGRELFSFQAHDKGVESITQSPDGQYIITKSKRDATTETSERKLWQLSSRKLVLDLSDSDMPMSIDPSNRYLLENGPLYFADTLRLRNLNGETILEFPDALSAFLSPDSRLVLAEYRDKSKKLWTLEGEAMLTTGQNVATAFSSDGRYFIHEKQKEPTIELIDLHTEEIATIPGFDDRVEAVVFLPDNQTFLTAEHQERGGTLLKVFDVKTKSQQSLRTLPISISEIHCSPDGKTVLISTEATTYLLDQNLEIKSVLQGFANHSPGAFFLPNGTDLVMEPDKVWDLKTNLITPTDSVRPFYSGITGDVLNSPDFQYVFGSAFGGPTPNLYGGDSTIAFVGHTNSVVSSAFSADGQFILTGSEDRTAKLWNLQGENLQTLIGHTGVIWSVAISHDNKLLATGGDSTIKLWEAKTGRELATLVLMGSTDWIVKTPSGLFDASPRAMYLMHYSLFYERDREYITIDVEQLKARYYEPGLLQKALGFSDEPIRPVENFEAVKLYPEVKAIINGDSLMIDLKERNGGIGRVSLAINGKEVEEELNPLPRKENAKRDHTIRYDLKQHRQYLYRHPDSTNIITIRAYNEEGWLKSEAVNLSYQMVQARTKGPGGNRENAAWTGTLDPKLYVICMGTSNYAGSKLDLQYADQDAFRMAKALAAVGAAQFTKDSLEVYCFSTTQADQSAGEHLPLEWQFADKNNLKATFDRIEKSAKAEDVIVVYLSGHGVAQGGADQTEFYYLTQGIASEDDLADPATRKAFTISSEELTAWINDVPALKQVLIIDACNSGQIVENLTGGAKELNSSQIRAIDRMQDRTGMFVLSGSASDKVSYEASEFGQGLLTYALLQGMQGEAIRRGEKASYIDVMALFQHARNRVPVLAAGINGIQTPMLGFPNQAGSFDIGILDSLAAVSIEVANKKPVVIRSLFLDETTFDDHLEVVAQLENLFREETQKGKDADLVYVDVNAYPKGYSLRGLYRREGDQIVVDARLFYGKKMIDTLAINHSDKPGRLVIQLMRKAKEKISEHFQQQNKF